MVGGMVKTPKGERANSCSNVPTVNLLDGAIPLVHYGVILNSLSLRPAPEAWWQGLWQSRQGHAIAGLRVLMLGKGPSKLPGRGGISWGQASAFRAVLGKLCG